jgi:archaellum component FlaC
MKDIEDALLRLDKLTQEEARMAAAESLTITRGIDDNVKDVDERLEGVEERVQSVDMKVEGIDDKVLRVESKVQGIDDKVLNVDSKVQGVEHRVGSVIQGESCLHSLAPESVLSIFLR